MRESQLIEYLGKIVFVKVDRKIHSRHPQFSELIYPINYGEIPGTVSGDGCPIDVYLVGWNEPLDHAYALIIAVIVRDSDVEDKLVGVRPNYNWNAQDIVDATHFQERFFKSRYVFLNLDPFNQILSN